MTATRQKPAWIVARKAALRLGVSEMMVYKWALLGRIRSIAEPGENVRFSEEDVDRLASKSTRTGA